MSNAQLALAIAHPYTKEMLLSSLPTHWLALALRRVALGLFLLCLLPVAAWANSPGKNGTRTIATLNTTVNQSTTLTVAAAAGASTITVASIAALTSPEATGGGALAAGDVILIYQARGATIDTANTPTYGDITSYGNAGIWTWIPRQTDLG